MSTIYITGAGVSSESGIPTFRGQDGFWTVGSVNYTPQEMATREMYLNAPDEFLLWYFRRFAAYRNVMPNDVHHWLSDKRLITQNIDGLDSKADNPDYIAIHGRLDRVTMLYQQGELVPLLDAPWEQVVDACPDLEDDQAVKSALLDAFRISKTSLIPEMGHSLKPFVLLPQFRGPRFPHGVGEQDDLTFASTHAGDARSAGSVRSSVEVSARLVGAAAFKAVGAGVPRPAGSIPVHLRHTASVVVSVP